MRLHVADVPSDAVSVAASGLRRLLASPAGGRHLLRDVSASDVSLTVPHRVFALGMNDINAKQPLDRVDATGWRFLVEVKQETIAEIELDCDPTSRELRFARPIQGPFELAMPIAIHAAESVAADVERVYEPRLLCIPALSLEALWLRSPAPAADFLVPLAPAPRRFEAFRLYPVRTFLDLMQAEAGSRSAFDSSPRIAVVAG
jgi:hypothetical protein